jgi:hypothetical protein
LYCIVLYARLSWPPRFDVWLVFKADRGTPINLLVPASLDRMLPSQAYMLFSILFGASYVSLRVPVSDCAGAPPLLVHRPLNVQSVEVRSIEDPFTATLLN